MENIITDPILGAKTLLEHMDSCDKILIGAGAGLSAAAGLSYMDRDVFRKYFPDMVRLGYHYEYELVGMRDDEWTPGRKWAYWATHINYVRNIFPPAELYKKLLKALDGRDFFVVTSNCDRQFMRCGFPMERLFEYQGNYDNMGCSVGCTEKTWNNAEYLQRVLQNIEHENFECRDEALPRCPYCGELADICFRGSDYEQESEKYIGFINSCANKSVCLIELGVGYNTPGVIRWPFERITYHIPEAKLFRVNTGYREYPDRTAHPEYPRELEGKAVSLYMDAAALIDNMYDITIKNGRID